MRVGSVQVGGRDADLETAEVVILPPGGLEPPQVTLLASKTSVSAIPPQRRNRIYTQPPRAGRVKDCLFGQS